MTTLESRVLDLYKGVLRQGRSFPPYFFTGDHGKHCAGIITRHVLEEKLKWTREDICSSLNRGNFEEYRLAGMLKSYFDHSIFKVVDNAYPGEFKPWELLRARRNVFVGALGKHTAREAVRWMIFEKLNYNPEDLHKITVQTFADHHLDAMLLNIYNGSPWAALQDAGIHEYNPWEIHQVPNGYWKGEQGKYHAIAATKWLIEERLAIPYESVPLQLRSNDFNQNGLGPMLKDVFSGSVYEATEETFPGMFKKWQFPLGNGYWIGSEGLIHAKEALEWLIFEKMKLTVDEIPYKFDRPSVKKYGLDTMLKDVFRGSLSRALDIVFPGMFKPEALLRAKNRKQNVSGNLFD